MFSELVELYASISIPRGIARFSSLLDVFIPILMLGLTYSLLEQRQRLQRPDTIHLFIFVPLLAWLAGGDALVQASGFVGKHPTIPLSVSVLIGIKILIIVFYLSYIWRLIRQTESANPERTGLPALPLLKRILTATTIVFFITYSAFILFNAGVPLPIDSDFIGCLMMTALIYYMTFTILRQPSLLIATLPLTIAPKYQKSKLDTQSCQQYAKQLQKVMAEQRPFLNDNLSLEDLAKMLELRPNQLSQVINDGLQLSFHDLVNTYRLEEVKRKLHDPKESHKTILALAYESGFQSKATFNRIFKATEGITPSAFRKQAAALD